MKIRQMAQSKFDFQYFRFSDKPNPKRLLQTTTSPFSMEISKYVTITKDKNFTRPEEGT